MANSNFVVKNGLTVGALEIDAATGNLVTSGTITGNLSTTSIAKNDTSIALNDTGSGSDIAVTVDGVAIFDITGSGIIPTVNSNGTTGFDLGSPSFAWRDVYVSSGSLYVNGQKVLQEDSGNIVVTADPNQNLVFQTSGSGSLELDPTGTGVVVIKGTLQIEGGANIASSDGNPISFSNSVDVDAIESRSTNTDLTLTANGSGVVRVADDMVVTGNLTISGTTTTVNTTTLSVADNIVDLNSDFTTGTPTENAGIRVLRGDESAVQIRWTESSDSWQITTDGSTYKTIATTNDVDSAVGALTHNHSSAYIVTSGNESSNSSGSLTLSAATLGFDMSGAVTYSVYLNRQLLRPTEVTVNTSTGALTFTSALLAQDDEIEAVWLGN